MTDVQDGGELGFEEETNKYAEKTDSNGENAESLNEVDPVDEPKQKEPKLLSLQRNGVSIKRHSNYFE